MSSILLNDIGVLKFRAGEYTQYRRTRAYPQLELVGGSAAHVIKKSELPDQVICENAGLDGHGVIAWKCTATLPEGVFLRDTQVICEGYSGPGDIYITPGSCQLKYKLELDKYGTYKRQHGYQSGNRHTDTTIYTVDDDEPISILPLLLITAGLFILIFSLVKYIISRRKQNDCEGGFIPMPENARPPRLRSFWRPRTIIIPQPSPPVVIVERNEEQNQRGKQVKTHESQCVADTLTRQTCRAIEYTMDDSSDQECSPPMSLRLITGFHSDSPRGSGQRGRHASRYSGGSSALYRGGTTQRFIQLCRTAFLVIWGPKFTKKRKLVLDLFLPSFVLFVASSIIYGSLTLTNIFSTQNSFSGKPVIQKPVEPWEVCYRKEVLDGREVFVPRFKYCFGIVNDAAWIEEPPIRATEEALLYSPAYNTPPFTVPQSNLLLSRLLNDFGRGNISQFYSVYNMTEAQARILDFSSMARMREIECPEEYQDIGCMPASDFGHFLHISWRGKEEDEDGKSLGRWSWRLLIEDTDVVIKMNPERYAPSDILKFGVDDGGWSGAYAYSYLLRTVGDMSDPVNHDEPSLSPLSSLPSRTDLAKKTLAGVLPSGRPLSGRAHTQTLSLVIDMVLLAVGFIVSFQLTNIVSQSEGINQILLQGGMHALPTFLAVVSYLFVHAALLLVVTLIGNYLMPDLYRPIYSSEYFTRPFGFLCATLAIVSYLLTTSIYASIFPTKTAALVSGVVLMVASPAITQLLEFQHSSWPYAVLAFFTPSSQLAFQPTALVRFLFVIRNFTSMPIVPGLESQKLTLRYILRPNFPTPVPIPRKVWEKLPERITCTLLAIRPSMICAIVSTLLQFLLFYMALCIRPREERGSYRWNALFSRLPTGKSLALHNERTSNGSESERYRGEVDVCLTERTGTKALRERDLLAVFSDTDMTQVAQVCRIDDLQKHYHLPFYTDTTLIESAGRLVRKNRSKYLAALNHVSLSFGSGKITGLLGVNGAGKSTLIRAILGIERPSGGQVTVLGVDPNKNQRLLLDALSLIGYVPQNNTVSDFSCLLHCVIACCLRGLPGGRDAWEKEGLRCLTAVGLVRDGKTHTSATALSGGQKRRLMVAIAMCGRPPLLILDEPSAGLSADAKIDLDLAIHAAAEDSSVLITEHDLDEVDGLTDTLAIMRDGAVVAEGTSLTLKEQYGQGYTLRVTLEGGLPLEDVEAQAPCILNLVHNISGNFNIRLDFRSGRDLFFILDWAAAPYLAAISRQLDEHGPELHIVSHALEIPTLSDVFARLASSADGGNDSLPKPKEDVTVLARSPVGQSRVIQSLIPKCLRSVLTQPSLGIEITLMVVVTCLLCGVACYFLDDIFYWSTTMQSKVSRSVLRPEDRGAMLAFVSRNSPIYTFSEDLRLSQEQLNDVTELMRRFSDGTARYIEPSAFSETIMANATRRPLALSKHPLRDMQGRDATDSAPPLILRFRDLETLEVWAPRDQMTNSDWTESIFVAQPQLVAQLLGQVRDGYDIHHGRQNSMLTSPRYRVVKKCFRSYTGDPRGVTYMIVSAGSAIYAMILQLTVMSMVIVIPYMLSHERQSGFARLLRLNGEIRGANVLSWLLSFGSIGALITLIVLTIFVRLPFVILDPDFDPADVTAFIALTSVNGLISSLFWSTFSVWVGYTIHKPPKAFTLFLSYYSFQLIYVITIIISTINTNEDTIAELQQSWKLILWVFGLIPFTSNIALTTTVMMQGFYPSVFSPDIVAASVFCMTETVWLGVSALLLYSREEIEWNPASNPTFWTRLLTLFSRTQGDIPHPTQRFKLKHGINDQELALPSVVAHPREDETVAIERRKVEDPPADAIVVYQHARREFRGNSEGAWLVQALRGLDLIVRRGECLGLVGENGAGKSTALSLAIHQLTPTSGSVRVLARRIGYVPQHDAVCDSLTVKAHIQLFARMAGMSYSDALRIAELCGMSQHLTKRPGHLSGGYRRRLSLTLALITSTDILIADEVAAGVDIHAQRAIHGLMDELKNSGCSLIVTSHSMETVDRLATRVAMLVKGRLRAIDTPDGLKRRYSQGIQVTLQIGPEYGQAALSWLASAVHCEKSQIRTLPASGGDMHFIIPPELATVTSLLEATAPGNRPVWIERAAVAPTSLQSVFLRFEEEARELGLKNW